VAKFFIPIPWWLLTLSVGDGPAPDSIPTLPPVVESRPGDAPLEGLWPSKKLMELMLQRWAEEVSEDYQLDEPTREKVREKTVKRWMKFLDDNRHEIQPLVNEFIEMRMELKPPEKERVRRWAERAMPMFDKFREQIKEGASEFSQLLPPLKRAKFELESLQFKAGLHLAEGKLKQWKEGDFKEDEFWEPRRSDRRRRRAEREGRSAEAETKPAPQDQIVAELKGWEEYVAEFIRQYDLDEGQRTTAASFLSEMKDRALAHRDRRKEDILRLEVKITGHSGTKEELEVVKQELVELYGPIDALFAELKERLDRLPTPAQREAATSRKPTPPRAEPDDKDS
jgi:hypothetical protein